MGGRGGLGAVSVSRKRWGHKDPMGEPSTSLRGSPYDTTQRMLIGPEKTRHPLPASPQNGATIPLATHVLQRAKEDASAEIHEKKEKAFAPASLLRRPTVSTTSPLGHLRIRRGAGTAEKQAKGKCEPHGGRLRAVNTGSGWEDLNSGG